ncbi:MAG: Tex-like N-terminal domain-containing protein [Myxococcota bacterium]
MTLDLSGRIAAVVSVPRDRVAAALVLFDGGATVPFVARYRKERTGGLDEVELRAIADHRDRLVELDRRLEAIRAALRESGKWTDGLDRQLAACTSRAELEELYAPYKKRRTTRADTARALGLEPLARKILDQPRAGDPAADARRFVVEGVEDAAAALAGARDIVAETLASDPAIAGLVRRLTRERGVLSTAIRKDAEGADKFRDYADYHEGIGRVPSHRYLAVCRGEDAGVLTVKLRPDPDATRDAVLRAARHEPRSPFGAELAAAVDDGLKRLLVPTAERAVRADRRLAAEDDALDVFDRNLGALLLAPPLGPRSVLGVDPGIRTGCKCALVSDTGALVEHHTLMLLTGGAATARLVDWLGRARPHAIAVGNGTGGREALAAVRDAVRQAGVDAIVVSISEAGASVYSASDVARDELPDVDLTVRGAVHLARRLRDPLAELVKVPPASLGVGQYQHDIDEARLTRRLHEVVESCVNRVGVELNTASPALLGYVAGIGPKLATAIARHRDQHGPFRTRRALLEVTGLGPKTFEQCAGFLRLRGGDQPLDASGVHPERYALVARIARDVGAPLERLIGDPAAVGAIDWSRYEDADTGRATLADIAGELASPGRDPRSEFEPPAFRDDVRELADLEVGMVLAGVVTNVTAFGAFVDIGVHQDGLVHVSELADRFVKSPHDVVSAGQPLDVVVLAVDRDRNRISLSAKRVP